MKGDGSGVTIALIEMYHDPNLASDLATFDQKYGLPTPTLTVVNLAGTQTNSSWGEEESLDVEWAHAIAPGANILVVEAAPGNTESQQLQNLMAAVQTASTTPGVAVVSMSWGFPEFSGETAYDTYFTTPGITYVAASGDSPGVEYPAASPDVVAVGGTTLALSSSGGYGSETAWDDSGGGYSQYEAEPAYQESVQTTGQRSTPDVAFDANPNTGVEIYFTPASGGGGWQTTQQGSWEEVGGTSLGTSGLGSHHRDRRSGSGRRPGEPGRLHADVAGALRRSLVRLQHGRGRFLIIRRRRRVRLRVRRTAHSGPLHCLETQASARARPPVARPPVPTQRRGSARPSARRSCPTS